jgi:hypothetical protein
VIVPSTVEGEVSRFVRVTVPVGTGVVWIVPETCTENVTLWPTFAVDGEIVSAVVLAARTGDIFPKKPRLNPAVAVVA